MKVGIFIGLDKLEPRQNRGCRRRARHCRQSETLKASALMSGTSSESARASERHRTFLESRQFLIGGLSLKAAPAVAAPVERQADHIQALNRLFFRS